MHQFTLLYTECTDGLPEEESLALYRDVTEMEDSAECRIDVSLVMSRSEAKQKAIKPVCESDVFAACESFVTNGLKTCKVDFCDSCPGEFCLST